MPEEITTMLWEKHEHMRRNIKFNPDMFNACKTNGLLIKLEHNVLL
jgi:hypothetical protein